MSDKFRILIVDDDKRIAKTLKDILTIKGYKVDIAHYSCSDQAVGH